MTTRQPPTTLTCYFLAAVLLVGVFLLLLQPGCSSSPPSVRGGQTQATLGEASARQPDNPAAAASTRISRTETVVESPFPPEVPAVHAQARGATAGASAPAVATAAAPRGVLVRTVTEQSETNIGGTQDVAGIMRWLSDGDRRAGAMAVFAGLALGVGAYFAWRRGWPVIAGILGVGAGAALYTLSVLWALVALGAGGALYLGYTVAERRAGAVLP